MSPMRWVIIGLGIALAVTIASWRIESARTETAHTKALSAEQQKTRDAQSTFDAYKLQVEQTIGANATQRARELSAALDRASELQDEVDRLRASYAVTAKERTDLANELLRRLNNAEKDMDSRLDARTRDYYRELRRRQTEGDNGSRSAPPGSAD